ncbi:uncharacterized protein MONOS_18013 [Monocercomonoides exilis]|uniref:uncharacterized protein n=1 Tax=Monocercomonoides exilis TaxID=2049356 RepID=UPI00355AA7F6|nr:hypothetical protein MONOS_18013 [Monocercomonoides exilis]
MNEIVDKMNENEIKSIFNKEIFNKTSKIIEEKGLLIENILLLLKRIGHLKVLKGILLYGFEKISLNKIFEKMIIEEEKKKERKNEKLLIDLCECYISLNYLLSPEIVSICVHCLLKVAMRKEENEEIQKEVEMALLELSCIDEFNEIEQELYLTEIKAIIKYHQEYHNLTQLAYQSAWQFLIYRLHTDKSLEEVIANELHFAREATRELEELTKCVDYQIKEEKEKGKNTEEMSLLLRWLQTSGKFLFYCRLRNEEYSVLIESIVKAFREAKDNCRGISSECIESFSNSVNNRNVKVEDLLKRGAVCLILEEIHRPTLNDEMVYESLTFFMNISERMKEKEDFPFEEAKRKRLKRKMFEKMEEEGFEDIITSFYELLDFLNESFHHDLQLDISDYFVDV